MLSVLLGSLGFFIYFIYDINSVTKKYRIFRGGFFVGTILVATGTVIMIVDGWKSKIINTCFEHICWGMAIVMFVLLIYTLFFALPFSDTYVTANEIRKVYTEGVYALCRHPGVLWYTGMYIAFIGAVFSYKLIIQSAVYILWNLLYVILQDKIIFPKTFADYEEYKKITPFLIPTWDSVKRCIKTIKKGGTETR